MTESRETGYQRLIAVLWHELRTVADTRHLETEIRRAGLGWALPSSPDFYDDDDWLTVDQIAFDLGYKQSAIRNWPRRYGIKPVHGKYRWGDIQRMLTERGMRRHAG